MGLKLELQNGDTWNIPDKGLRTFCRMISDWYAEKQKKEQEETTLPETTSSAPNNVLNNKTLEL